MPQRRNARKELRKNYRNEMHNLDVKTDLRKTLKQLMAEIQTKKTDEAKATLCLAFKKLDKAVKHNVLNKNTAAHRKSLISRAVQNIKK